MGGRLSRQDEDSGAVPSPLASFTWFLGHAWLLWEWLPWECFLGFKYLPRQRSVQSSPQYSPETPAFFSQIMSYLSERLGAHSREGNGLQSGLSCAGCSGCGWVLRGGGSLSGPNLLSARVPQSGQPQMSPDTPPVVESAWVGTVVLAAYNQPQSAVPPTAPHPGKPPALTTPSAHGPQAPLTVLCASTAHTRAAAASHVQRRGRTTARRPPSLCRCPGPRKQRGWPRPSSREKEERLTLGFVSLGPLRQGVPCALGTACGRCRRPLWWQRGWVWS